MRQGRLFTRPLQKSGVKVWDMPCRPFALFLSAGGTLLVFAASVGRGSPPVPARTQTMPVMPPAAQSFLRQNCLACHNKTSAKGGLDLTTAFRPEVAANFSLWVKVHDRVAAGEMPPKPFPPPAAPARKNFPRRPGPTPDCRRRGANPARRAFHMAAHEPL